MIENREINKLPEIIKSEDFNLKITSYADYRISPFHIVTVDERFNDLRLRYKEKSSEMWNKRWKECLLIEKQIQENVFVDLQSLNDDSIQEFITELREYNLH